MPKLLNLISEGMAAVKASDNAPAEEIVVWMKGRNVQRGRSFIANGRC